MSQSRRRCSLGLSESKRRAKGLEAKSHLENESSTPNMQQSLDSDLSQPTISDRGSKGETGQTRHKLEDTQFEADSSLLEEALQLLQPGSERSKASEENYQELISSLSSQFGLKNILRALNRRFTASEVKQAFLQAIDDAEKIKPSDLTSEVRILCHEQISQSRVPVVADKTIDPSSQKLEYTVLEIVDSVKKGSWAPINRIAILAHERLVGQQLERLFISHGCYAKYFKRGKLTQENLFDQFTPVNVAIVNPQTIYNIGESIFQFLSIIVEPIGITPSPALDLLKAGIHCLDIQWIRMTLG